MFSCIKVFMYMTVLVLHSAGVNVSCNDGNFSCNEIIIKPTTARNEAIFKTLQNSEKNVSRNDQGGIGKSMAPVETTGSKGVTSRIETATELAVKHYEKSVETIVESNEGGTETVFDNDTDSRARLLRNEIENTPETTTKPDRPDNDDARSPGKVKPSVTDNAGNSARVRTSGIDNENDTRADKDFTATSEPTSDLEQSFSELSKESEWPMLGLPGIENDEDISLGNINRAFNALLPQGFVFENMFVDLLSCHNRCGLSFESPCSCHSLCILYNNCCPDFKVKCPSILQDAVGRFSSELLEATVECRGSLPQLAWIVTTCPNHTVQENSRNDNVEDTSSVNNLEASIEDQIKKVLKKRPCTDMSTGITYINKDVYDCYATESSVLQYWIPMMSLAKSTITPRSLQDFNSVLNFSEFTFQPAPGITLQNCPSEILDSCPNDTISQDLKNKCIQGSIYYLDVSDWETRPNLPQKGRFPNIHCLLCNINGQEKKTVGIFRNLFFEKNYSKYRVLMRVYDSGKVVYTSLRSNPTSWGQIDCDTNKELNQCHTTACKNPSNTIEDNCLTPSRIIVSLDSNFVEAVEAIKEDLVCALHNNDLYEMPVLQELEQRKDGLHIFYIQFLSRTHITTIQNVQNQFLEIIGYHLYNTTRTELAAEETKEKCEPESMDIEIRETQRMNESNMASETIASSGRPTRLETKSDRLTLQDAKSERPALSETTRDRPTLSETTSDTRPLLKTTSERSTLLETTSEGLSMLESTSVRFMPSLLETTSDRPTLPENTSDSRPTLPENTSDRPTLPENTSDRPTLPENTSDRPTLPENTSDRPTLPENTSDRPRLPENTSDRPTLPENTSDRPALPLATNGRCNQTQDKQVTKKIVGARACTIAIAVKLNYDIHFVVDNYCTGLNIRVFEEKNFTSKSPYTKAPVFNRSQCGIMKKIPPATSTEKQEPVGRTTAETNSASHGCMDMVILSLPLSVLINMICLVKNRP